MNRKYRSLIIVAAIANLTVLAFILTLTLGADIAEALGRQTLSSETTTVPNSMYYQGWMGQSDGTPLEGTKNVTFRICKAATGSACTWEETHTDVDFVTGQFTVLLGSQGTPITSGLFSAAGRWVEMEVAGEVLTPRLQLASMPYAFNAARLDGQTADDLIDQTGGTPSGALAWFREGATPTGYTRVTGTLGKDMGAWEPLSQVPEKSIRPVYDPGYAENCKGWTGSELLCWSDQARSGARYNPDTDVWTPMASAGSPITRDQSSFLWTGSQLIVWGGADWGYTVEFFNDGATYDPAQDVWTPISTEGAPSPRRYAFAEKVGGDVIIWAGSDMTGSLNTGGRYDLKTDTWKSMTTTNAPAAPEGESYTVVAAGDQLFVREYRGSSHLYDPQTDTWSEASAVGQPMWENNWFADAHWTGTEVMLIGNGSPVYFYNPATDSWRTAPGIDVQMEDSYYESIQMGSRVFTFLGIYDLEDDRWMTRSGDKNLRATLFLSEGDTIIAVDRIRGDWIVQHKVDIFYPYTKD